MQNEHRDEQPDEQPDEHEVDHQVDHRDFAIPAAGPRRTFGPVAALDGLQLDVRRGTIHGLRGPNGCAGG